MDQDLVAKVSVTVNAPRSKVWDALVDPATIKAYMFGTTVESDWREGSRITWKGEWKGRPYEDKGVILRVLPGRVLSYTHFSPLSGLADVPENHHKVTIELTDEGAGTRLTLSQDRNATEVAREHSEQNWTQALTGLKAIVEKPR